MLYAAELHSVATRVYIPFNVYQAIVTNLDTLLLLRRMNCTDYFMIITLWNTRRVHSIVGIIVHDKIWSVVSHGWFRRFLQQ